MTDVQPRQVGWGPANRSPRARRRRSVSRIRRRCSGRSWSRWHRWHRVRTLRCRRRQWAGSWSRCAAASTTLVVRTGTTASRAGEGTLRPRPSCQACWSWSHQRPSARVAHHGAMRPAAGLAAALGAHEPDPVADLLPVDRVVPAQLRLDRHRRRSRLRRPGPRCAPAAGGGRGSRPPRLGVGRPRAR
jgi:hypothetical protein